MSQVIYMWKFRGQKRLPRSNYRLVLVVSIIFLLMCFETTKPWFQQRHFTCQNQNVGVICFRVWNWTWTGKTRPKWVNWKSLRLTFGDYYLIPSRKKIKCTLSFLWSFVCVSCINRGYTFVSFSESVLSRTLPWSSVGRPLTRKFRSVNKKPNPHDGSMGRLYISHMDGWFLW